MSFGDLVAQTCQALSAARDLYGRAPAAWSPGDQIVTGRETVAAVRETGWQGLAKTDYDAANTRQQTELGAIADADQHTSQAATEAGREAASGRDAMNGIIRDTQEGAKALEPVAQTPAGQEAVAEHLSTQLKRATAVLVQSARKGQMIADRLQAGAAGYGRGRGMGGGGSIGGFGGGGGSFGGGSPASLMSASHRNPQTPGNPTHGALIQTARRIGGIGLPPGVAAEAGLQRDTVLAARAVSAAFPQITDIGGVRPDALKWHPNGQAIDVMIPDPLSPEGIALGDSVLQFALAHAQQFDVNHIIWQNVIYNADGSSSGFGADWSDITQAHRNHVHIATNGGGYPSGGETYKLA